MPPPTDPEELARRARVEQAADARSRRGGFAQLEDEEATLRSLLGRLSRDGRAVRLGTVAGPRHGTVAELGPDHVRLDARGRWCYLPLSAITTVEALDDAGSAPAAIEVRAGIVEALARRAGTPVTLVLADGTVLAGELAAAGRGVVTLRRPPPATPVYASSSAVVSVLGDGSG